MAIVYHALDPRFKRDVAIKVLPREFLHDPSFLERFEREAQTIAALEHGAIVPVYDFGEEDGQPYIVMRYMAGGSLKARLERGAISMDETIRILRRIAPALDTAHAKGVVHRDIKPDNILFDPQGEAHLSDFGIVKLSEASAALTGSAIIGTPAYMSPEQASGEGELDGRSDIYTLGVLLFEMLTGQQPYSADTPMRQLMKHIMDPVPQILDVKSDLPPGVGAIIAKVMAKDRNERYATAGELVEAVAALTKQPEGQKSVKELEAREEPVPKTVLLPDEDQAAAKVAPAPKRRRKILPWLVAAAALGGIALCSGLGVLSLFAPDGRLGQESFSATQTAEARQSALATVQALETQVAGEAQAATGVQAQIANQFADIRSGEPVSGPINASLVHQSGEFITTFPALELLRDFVMEAEFFNPYSTAEGQWDFGVVFRDINNEEQLRLRVLSNSTWALESFSVDEDFFVAQDGSVDNLDTSGNGSNRIILVAINRVGFFFLNGEFISELDLSRNTVSGQVSVATELVLESGIAGEVTEVEDFTVWVVP